MRRSGLVACPNVLEDLGDDVGIFDTGNHSELAAAFRASLYIDGEYPFQSLHPGHGGERFIWFLLSGFAFWHDGLPMLAVRGEHTVEAGEVEPWARDQCCQAGDEVERIEHDMRRAVTEWLLETCG